jgi:uncharacterized protein (TIGR03663 family)
MTSARAGYGGALASIVVVVALAAGLALRMVQLDTRPMHHDEANQALKFGALLEHGEYTYDPDDHHGPTLYYLTLPLARLRGQETLASLDEWTLRAIPVAFGAAAILLLPLLTAGLGRTAVASSALLMALSPALVFYARMYIQESVFAFFTLAFAVAAGRATTEAGWRWPVLAGVAAGLAGATKETAVIVIPAALGAGALAWRSLGSLRLSGAGVRTRWRDAALAGVATAGGVAAIFYSSFLAHPGGVLAPFRAAAPYLQRGVAPADHAHPWHYYLGLLGWSSSGGLVWSEALVLILAAVGAAAAWTRVDRSRPEATFWRRYLTGSAALILAAYSVIPYKTPWNLLPFYTLAVVSAGVGCSALAQWARPHLTRGVLAGALVLGCAHLGWQAWRAAVVYASDPRNPYVYAQTVPGTVRMAARIRELASLHDERERMAVTVIAPAHEQWPLPWYLRTMTHVGYWTDTTDSPDLTAPVIVSSMAHSEAVDAALADRYVSEFYGLRPEVLLTLYVERRLWDRFLAHTPTTAGTAPARPELARTVATRIQSR